MSFEAILFDLDNTLILFDEARFFEQYTRAISTFFDDILEPDEFQNRLLFSTQELIHNKGEQINIDYFMDRFSKGLHIDSDDLMKRFYNFYETKFKELKPITTPLNNAGHIIGNIARDGYKLVIASNPLLPLQAQHMRMQWAGISDIKFDLVTGIDNSSACKPVIEYYSEICNKINTPPSSCLMVGNDPFNDMIASNIGMKTYLTTDSSHMSIELSRELAENMDIEFPMPDSTGSLASLKAFIDSINE